MTHLAPPRHFLDLRSFAKETLRAILSEALRRKEARQRSSDRPLRGRALLMLFEQPSLRTRISFERAMREAGGDALVITDSDTHRARGEALSDMARVMSLYGDILMIRAHRHETLLEVARHAAIPVINGLSDQGHPCQILADIMTFEEKIGPIEGRSLAWIGDANNMAASWAEAARIFGFHLRIASPNMEALSATLIEETRRAGFLKILDAPQEAAEGADCVMTDAWASLSDDDEGARRKRRSLAAYRVDQSLMRRAKDHAIFMHCLPAHRGEEVSAEVMDGRQSVVFEEAENRLHLQKALLLWCLGLIEE